MLEELKNPPFKYRPIPFWSWNDKLDSKVLKWQIHEMKESGLGGFFMHARGGLKTTYLSNEWMECIEVSIDKGNKLNMGAWCYDEEGWPSGFAGGEIPVMNEAYQIQWIDAEITNHINIVVNKDMLGVYKINHETNLYERIFTNNQIVNINHETYIIIYKRTSPYYIDILNKEVVSAFINSTYQKYYQKFGNSIIGFFTDEPQYARDKVPWSTVLEEEFNNQYNYSLLDYLPSLFYPYIGHEAVRYDFWNIVSSLYVSAFGKQIFEWCDERNYQFTGHVLGEDDLFSQMSGTAGVMPFYEYMHIPGIDWLGREIGSPVIPKQVASVASQLGKKQVTTETFALCGWNISLEEMKWIAQWQCVNGVNLLCQHLQSYSLQGARKRDYPPSLFYQQPWWKEYKVFNDYFARLGMLLAESSPVVNVLVIHPIRSAWLTYDRADNQRLNSINQDFLGLCQRLSNEHFDYHFGDETLIGKYGYIEGEYFIIGQCKYKTVILPSMITLDYKTITLLCEFIKNGGRVYSIGEFPNLCNGRTNPITMKLRRLSYQCKTEYDLVSQISETKLITIAYEDIEISSIHYQMRKYKEYILLYMVNLDQFKTFNAKITLTGRYMPIQYCIENGDVKELFYECHKNETIFTLKFEPTQSHMILLSEYNVNDVKEVYYEQSRAKFIELGENWWITQSDLNSITLDYCYYQIDDNVWEGPIPIIKLMNKLLGRQKACDITLRFEFNIETKLKEINQFFAVIENAEKYIIEVNGREINYNDEGWWKDISFKKVNVYPFLKTGKNIIILKRYFYQRPKVYEVLFGKEVLETEINKLTYDVELESIYLLGDFGVYSTSEYIEGEKKSIYTKGPFVISNLPSQVKMSSLTEQGFCFFAGAINLSQTLRVNKIDNERILLKLPQTNCVLVKLYINGAYIKSFSWRPYIVNITDYVLDEEIEITLRFFGSNRNLLGPHHHILGELYHVGPASFTEKSGWTESMPIETPIWEDGYWFVKFGLDII